MNTTNISPLRYPGGKTRACKVLDKVMTDNFNMDNFTHIVSPFLGGGSFELFLQNTYSKYLIVNDIFTPLINFWIMVKSNRNNLCDALETHLNTIDKPTFYTLREKHVSLTDTFEQAIDFFILNRCSFSGSTLSGGFSQESSVKRFTQSSIDRVRKLELDYVTMYNQDFEPFLNDHSNSEYLFFIDPPYFLGYKSNLYGDKGDTHSDFDHDRLFKVLCERKNWMMTYNDCEYIRNLYSEFTIIDTNWSYGMNKTKKSSEIIIISK